MPSVAVRFEVVRDTLSCPALVRGQAAAWPFRAGLLSGHWAGLRSRATSVSWRPQTLKTKVCASPRLMWTMLCLSAWVVPAISAGHGSGAVRSGNLEGCIRVPVQDFLPLAKPQCESPHAPAVCLHRSVQ